MKSLLFVINTLGQGGAEVALTTLLEHLDPNEYDIDLYVMVEQGNLIHRVPDYVHVLNTGFDDNDVLDAKGKRHLTWNLFKKLLHVGSLTRNLPYIVSNYRVMKQKQKVFPEKLLWKPIADSAPHPEKTYDLAVAYLEGASAYYVARSVRAKKKACFIHIHYGMSGYTRELDLDCYAAFDRILTVGEDVRDSFVNAYPEYADKTVVSYNLVDRDLVLERAEEGIGFEDGYDGIRILSVSRLVSQKAVDVCIDAMKILKERGLPVRWYVLGEGNEREKLEKLIRKYGLEEDFILYGTVDNPFPYYRQCNIYVQSSRYEGRSIALQEAQIMGKPMVVSDCPGNRKQVMHEKTGLIAPVDAAAIADAVQRLIDDPSLAERLGAAAAMVNNTTGNLSKLLELLEDNA